IESRTCSFISREERPPVVWMRRSASVDLPWSMCAMIAKLRIFSWGEVDMGAVLSIRAALREACCGAAPPSPRLRPTLGSAAFELTMIVRPATEADLPAILAIYNDAVLNTTAIWNDSVADLDNRRQWFNARAALNYPVLVAADDGAILGYASFSDFRAFDG